MTSPPPAAALALWREIAGDPDALRPGTTTVVTGSSGLCPPGWTGVMRLGGAFAVEVGDASVEAIGTLVALDDPSDPDEVGHALHPSETLGPGVLAYLPEGITLEPDGDEEVAEVDVTELAVWLGRQPGEEVEESSLGEMDRALVLRRDGHIVAAGGHLPWPTGVAHLGVLVDADQRGSGVGTAIGRAATVRALRAGLTPQWRAAAWNSASRAAARRLGFVEHGRQFSFVLTER